MEKLLFVQNAARLGQNKVEVQEDIHEKVFRKNYIIISLVSYRTMRPCLSSRMHAIIILLLLLIFGRSRHNVVGGGSCRLAHELNRALRCTKTADAGVHSGHLSINSSNFDCSSASESVKSGFGEVEAIAGTVYAHDVDASALVGDCVAGAALEGSYVSTCVMYGGIVAGRAHLRRSPASNLP